MGIAFLRFKKKAKGQVRKAYRRGKCRSVYGRRNAEPQAGFVSEGP